MLLTLLSPFLSLIGWEFFKISMPRGVTFDWSERVLRIRTPLSTSRMPFSRIQHLQLSISMGGGEDEDTTAYQVIAHATNEKSVLAEGTLADNDAEARQPVVAFATELAGALGIELKRGPLRGPDVLGKADSEARSAGGGD